MFKLQQEATAQSGLNALAYVTGGQRKAKRTKTQRSSRLFGEYYLYKKRHRSGKKCQLVDRDDEVKLRFLGFQERPGHYLIEKNTNLVNVSRCQVCGTVFE